MKKITLFLSAVLLACATNLWAETLTIDFESKASTYTDWTLTNMPTQVKTSDATAPQGSYYGTTDGKETASAQTKEVISQPISISFSVSKLSSNSTTSSWKIQVSSDAKSWTDVKEVSASSMTKGVWVDVSQDLSSYSNVYVRVYYDGTTAKRAIDNIVLTYMKAPLSELTAITISGEPTKKNYIVGDSLDVTGLTATATYKNDLPEADITAFVNWTLEPKILAESTTSIKVKASLGDVTSDEIIINGISVRALFNYDITWKVNGETYTTGNPTISVLEGNKIIILPTAPADNTLSCTNAFVGWSTTNLGAEAGLEKPDDLFMEAEKAPMPTGDMTFYAVFASATKVDNTNLVSFTSGGKEDLAKIEGITTSGLGGDYADSNAPYLVKFDHTNDNIVWQNTNSNFVNTVSFDIKMLGGSSTSTMTVQTSENGETYKDVQACEIKGSQNTELSFKVDINANPAYIKLNFTKGSNVGLGNLIIVGTGVSYADYRTACGTTPSAIDNIAVETPAVKTIENGQLIILRDGLKYNAMGVRLQ